jgi:hypothetical protein
MAKSKKTNARGNRRINPQAQLQLPSSSYILRPLRDTFPEIRLAILKGDTQMNPESSWGRNLLLAPLLLIFSAVAVSAQDKSPQKPEATPDAHQTPDATRPGPEQEFLAKRAGEYNRTIKFAAQPNADATASSGTSKISVALGGRFIVEENNDTVFGRPVSGTRIYGFNNITKQYEAVWMYTGSTAMIFLTGTSTDGGKTVDLTGMTQNVHGDKIPLHAIIRQIDDNQFVVTLMSAGPDGKEAAFQETTYTRKK